MKVSFKKTMEKEEKTDDIYLQSFLKLALMEIKNIDPLEITQALR